MLRRFSSCYLRMQRQKSTVTVSILFRLSSQVSRHKIRAEHRCHGRFRALSQAGGCEDLKKRGHPDAAECSLRYFIYSAPGLPRPGRTERLRRLSAHWKTDGAVRRASSLSGFHQFSKGDWTITYYTSYTRLPTVLGYGRTSLMFCMPVRYMTQRSKPRP